MNDKLKCPFCQQELRKIHPTYIICDNCRITGEDKLWQSLIRTRKALDVAVVALNAVTATPLNSRVIHDVANNALEQITALNKE